MDTNQLNFERVWHGSHRRQRTLVWPTYVAELIFAVFIGVLLVLGVTGI
ncbi:hypothetical protein [Arthrobacter alpinus]|nr:hypothetical protein [Arthrobacter alpinus]